MAFEVPLRAAFLHSAARIPSSKIKEEIDESHRID